MSGVRASGLFVVNRQTQQASRCNIYIKPSLIPVFYALTTPLFPLVLSITSPYPCLPVLPVIIFRLVLRRILLLFIKGLSSTVGPWAAEERKVVNDFIAMKNLCNELELTPDRWRTYPRPLTPREQQRLTRQRISKQQSHTGPRRQAHLEEKQVHANPQTTDPVNANSNYGWMHDNQRDATHHRPPPSYYRQANRAEMEGERAADPIWEAY